MTEIEILNSVYSLIPIEDLGKDMVEYTSEQIPELNNLVTEKAITIYLVEKINNSSKLKLFTESESNINIIHYNKFRKVFTLKPTLIKLKIEQANK